MNSNTPPKASTSKSKKATGNPPAPQRLSVLRVGTRSVNTLSEAQLERKRANDREAQRNLRTKRRELIENLERQVAKVGEQLDKALQHNSQLEARVAAQQNQFAYMAVLLQHWQSNGVQSYT